MRLRLMGVLGAAAIAVTAAAAPTPSGGPAPADTRASLPAAHAPPVAAPSTAVGPQKGPAPVQHYVDLNSASRKELMTLPGIGPAEASRVVANRPYLTKTELVTKNVLPIGPFLSLKHLVVAMPATVSKGRP